MKKKILTSQLGFTLIELLVAMAIIGIMAGAILVSMSSFRDRARENAALQTASSVMPAAMKCDLENNPLSNGAPVAGQPVCTGSSFTWPTIGSGSTSGWIWAWKGNSGSGSASAYSLCSTSDCKFPYILCAVSWDGGWPAGGYTGIAMGGCVIKYGVN